MKAFVPGTRVRYHCPTRPHCDRTGTVLRQRPASNGRDTKIVWDNPQPYCPAATWCASFHLRAIDDRWEEPLA